MLNNSIGVCNSRVLVLGFAFKENCPDLRNTRVIDIIQALREYNIAVDCYDPWIDRTEAKQEYGLDCLPEAPAPGSYDAVILAVAHRDFIAMGATGIRNWAKPTSILYDVKSVLPVGSVDGRL
ncbi:UDP binding domain-containing protein [Thiocapsa rosea]|uniref:UDP binding domain-containing protein n=1 Tax=Thiocapsa rosea TaxID=69360 RepID=UPI001FE6A936|nr:UDP binding domain-containing protein [Thiocapsa rosea]